MEYCKTGPALQSLPKAAIDSKSCAREALCHLLPCAFGDCSSGRVVAAYRGLQLFSAQKQTPCLREQTGGLEFNLDDDLLSHGETPHYHRRCIVSLLSSGWDQVVPMLYGRQEIR